MPCFVVAYGRFIVVIYEILRASDYLRVYHLSKHLIEGEYQIVLRYIGINLKVLDDHLKVGHRSVVLHVKTRIRYGKHGQGLINYFKHGSLDSTSDIEHYRHDYCGDPTLLQILMELSNLKLMRKIVP